MTSEPAAEGQPPHAAQNTAPPRFKVRLRFGKGYNLRLLSHHDLIRAFERLFRRAEIPVSYSRGFNPHPRMVFALSLPLGVIGLEEVLEIELDQLLPLEELQQRIRSQAPPGLEIQSLRVIDSRITGQVASLCYRLAVPPDRVAALQEQIPEVLKQQEILIARARSPRRRIDLRPSISQLRLVELANSAPLTGELGVDRSTWHYTLELELTPTPAGTARPEEVYAMLGQPDLLEVGSVLERSRLLLVDELPPITPEGTTCPRSC